MPSFRSWSPFMLIVLLPIGLLLLSAQQKSSSYPSGQKTDMPRSEHAPLALASAPVSTAAVRMASELDDSELIQMLSVERIGVDPEETEISVREDVDVTGDGKNDVLFGGTTYGGRVPFLAILSQPSDGDSWRPIYYSDKNSRYWANVRIKVEEDRIVGDFLTVGGGTGYLELVLWQRWIECTQSECLTTWEYPILRTWQTSTGPLREISRGYQTTEVMQQAPDTIQLDVQSFSLNNVPYDVADDFPVTGSDRTYWSVGPKSEQIFHRNDDVYVSMEERQIAPEIQILRPFNEQTIATTLFLAQLLDKQNETYEAYKIDWAEFWGLPLLDEPSDPVWGAWHQKIDAAATDGFQSQYRVDEETTKWVAGVTSAIDRRLCRLTVQEYRDEQFELIGRVEMPCVSNFTQLDYADVDKDGDSELLLLTTTPEGNDPATIRRLYIYAVDDDSLRNIAEFDGTINGPDMAGVRWEESPDGFKVMTGLPLVDLSCQTDDWSCITQERQFDTHIWRDDLQGFEILPGEK